uniref:Amino acid transporter transmembrane domain-containing protein n=1 Tax=Helicotheca tamesis TaxID=374047 RepID=A0A7S2H3F0_9STRA|eukprot:CAMPEP_0185726706 /NCGR_PEP_ID=MMETSP1171-20130828/2596_1 /TAXON_ID=374046 /ORGANISM="Helicotheca tamensis, Strain CCMP826" /LENGTH=639 /DNA_ID=CAMNT_0028395101 /DNA_START=148 /DNA_END=2067 /DNA_ORIENTATION=-
MSNDIPSTTNTSSSEPEENNDGDNNTRQGTIMSARWNLLSSMVGGGTLSLPLAFRQMGIAFLGPLLLILVALCVQFTIIFLIKAASAAGGGNNASNDNNKRGQASLELLSSKAFGGSSAKVCTMLLVCTICFFATTGYAVLLRDLLEPLADHIIPPSKPDLEGPTFGRNLCMMIAVLIITPLTTLKTLTALKNVGAASMTSLLLLSVFIFIRSVQCNFSSSLARKSTSFGDYINYTPSSLANFLDALPIFISSFVCHFNVLSVHNELQNPTSQRVSKLVSTTIWPAAFFYIFVGVSGSMYGNCTADEIVQGNILLDFDDNDVLMNVGRICLVVTISLTFPMLVLPIRDLVLRNGDVLLKTFCSWLNIFGRGRDQPMNGENNKRDDEAQNNIENNDAASIFEKGNDLAEPLLPNAEGEGLHHRSASSIGYETTEGGDDGSSKCLKSHDNTKRSTTTYPLSLEEERHRRQEDVAEEQQQESSSSSYGMQNAKARIITAIVIFWSASLVACSVQSIDVVWDLLGSSLSIIIAFLIPCGSYLILVKPKKLPNQSEDDEMLMVNDSGSGGQSNMVVETDTSISSMMVEGRIEVGRNEKNIFQRCCFNCRRRRWNVKRIIAWIIILVFIPLMFICTGNAIYNVVS